ncbi:unnamed protein product [Caenorhabditis auriculariae]|uniref:Uncharacterized protein n=1 Tax=Caenorhabditis auriculariae TaxID=2777116 RepID=A0A8S1H1K9_9PELO|nr:unnamed protein product [Caenorhabditis auriculariae]
MQKHASRYWASMEMWNDPIEAIDNSGKAPNVKYTENVNVWMVGSCRSAGVPVEETMRRERTGGVGKRVTSQVYDERAAVQQKLMKRAQFGSFEKMRRKVLAEIIKTRATILPSGLAAGDGCFRTDVPKGHNPRRCTEFTTRTRRSPTVFSRLLRPFI